MSKKKRDRALADNEAKAIARMLRVSRRSSISRRSSSAARRSPTRLPSSNFRASASPATCGSASNSAIANAENNHDLDVDDLVVAEAYVGKAW